MKLVTDSPTVVLPTKAEPSFPEWLVKLINRQNQLNKKYEKAHNEFAQAYNDFVDAVAEINDRNGTDFNLEQAMTEFEGFPVDVDDDEDDDED